MAHVLMEYTRVLGRGRVHGLGGLDVWQSVVFGGEDGRWGGWGGGRRGRVDRVADKIATRLMHTISPRFSGGACLLLRSSLLRPTTDSHTKPAAHHCFVSWIQFRRIMDRRQGGTADKLPRHGVRIIPITGIITGMC